MNYITDQSKAREKLSGLKITMAHFGKNFRFRTKRKLKHQDQLERQSHCQ